MTSFPEVMNELLAVKRYGMYELDLETNELGCETIWKFQAHPTASPGWKSKNQGLSDCAHQCLHSIILQSFNLVGHVMKEEIEKTKLLTDGWTDIRPIL